jgi:DNA polymerase I
MLILVDSNGLAYRAKYVMGNLSFSEKDTGVIFGFLNQVLKLADLFQSNKFVFAWDSRHSIRSVRYPRYRLVRKQKKVLRTPTEIEADKNAWKQFVELRTDVLPDLGFENVFIQPGYEADDVVASIATRSKEEEVMIVSSDHDYYQLLDGRISMYSPALKKTITAAALKKEWGVDAYMWKVIMAITGCKTDSISGVPGIGEKKAIKYLKGGLDADDSIVETISAYSNRIYRNTTLVELPMQGTREFELVEDKITEKKLKKVFSTFGFTSFLTGGLWSKWKRTFCGGKHGTDAVR